MQKRLKLFWFHDNTFLIYIYIYFNNTNNKITIRITKYKLEALLKQYSLSTEATTSFCSVWEISDWNGCLSVKHIYHNGYQSASMKYWFLRPWTNTFDNHVSNSFRCHSFFRNLPFSEAKEVVTLHLQEVSEDNFALWTELIM